MHTLISDGGSMTVGRRTANYTWGAFEVVLPEGLEQQETEERLQDGYIYRPDDRGHGRAELTFVRADAHIDMNAQRSDLEQTLDGASERTKGDAYYTRQISGVGLGKTTPGVDYRQGDMVRVKLWAKYLELPVTAIIRGKSADGSTADVAAQVGGQMLRDAELLRKRNDDVDSQIAAEKRERLRQVGAVDSKAAQAKDTADSAKDTADTAESKAEAAQGTADTAKEGVDDLTGSLAGPGATQATVDQQMRDLADQLAAQGEDAPPGLIPAYMHANNERWRMQEEINAANSEASKAHTAAINANRKYIRLLMQAVVGMMLVPVESGAWSDSRISVVRSGGQVAVTALDNWRGTITITSTNSQGEETWPIVSGHTVPYVNGRDYSWTVGGRAIIHYQVNPGVISEYEESNAVVQTLDSGEWTTLISWIVPEDSELLVAANWVWVNKTSGGGYSGGIRLNGVDVTQSYTSAAAPIFGHGRRNAQVSTNWIDAKKGDVVEIRAWASHGNRVNRRVDSVVANFTTITEEQDELEEEL